MDIKGFLFQNDVLPPVRFELTTPGLRDQCSTTELKRLRYLLLDRLIEAIY